MLHKGKSNIYLSFDLWTFENNLVLLTVVSYFIDENDRHRIILLIIRRIYDSYFEENMAQKVIIVIREYDITRRLEFFVLDNAEFNDICVDAVLKAIRLDLEKKTRRLRCLDYIMNLVA